MDCEGRNWPLAGPAQTPSSIDAPTHKPPASHRHRPLEREHSHSSSVFTGASCCSRSSTSAKLLAGGRGEGNGEWESSHVVSGDAVRQSPGSTPLGRSILTRRGDGVGRSAVLRDRWRRPRRRATGFCHAAAPDWLRRCSARLWEGYQRLASPRSSRRPTRQIQVDTMKLLSAASDGAKLLRLGEQACRGARRASSLPPAALDLRPAEGTEYRQRGSV